jgi:MFS family permease
MSGQSRTKWIVLISSFLAMFSFLFSMQTIPPLIPSIQKAFGVDYSAVSTLMLLVALPSVFLSIFSGFFAQKYGIKKMTSLGLLLVSAGSILSTTASTFELFQVARLIMGIGGALVAAIAPISIYEFFGKKELGAPMGVIGQAMPLATVIAFNTLGVVQTNSGWRFAVAISAVISIVCLLIYLVAIKEKKVAPAAKLDLRVLKNRRIWLLGLIWAFFNMAAVGYSTWGGTLFSEFNSLPSNYSNFLASMFMLGGFACPLAGYLSDKVQRRKIFLIVSTAGNTLVFAAFVFINASLFLPFAILLGIFNFLLPPIVFSLPQEILGVGNGGIGMGLLNSFLNAGVVIGPTLIGLILDSARNETFSFLLLSGYMAVALIMALGLKTK